MKKFAIRFRKSPIQVWNPLISQYSPSEECFSEEQTLNMRYGFHLATRNQWI